MVDLVAAVVTIAFGVLYLIAIFIKKPILRKKLLMISLVLFVLGIWASVSAFAMELWLIMICLYAFDLTLIRLAWHECRQTEK